MYILHSLLTELKEEFAWSKKGQERGSWFIYTLLAIILPFTSSRTSNLLRTLITLFGFSYVKKKTILHIHGVNKNSLESPMVKGEAFDP